MRLLLPMLLALPLLALQTQAQTAPPAPSIATPDAPAPNALGPTAPVHHRMSWQQHFTEANLAHDGHLTLQEASGGYPTMARHFSEIDADKKGYVTQEDITNWHKLQRAMRHSGQGRTNDVLRPRPAFQRGMTEPQPINTSTNGMLLPTAPPDPHLAGQDPTTK